MFNARSAVTIEDLRRRAKKRTPDFLFAPMDTGAGNGAGNLRNVERLREQLLVPRVLVDISAVTQATSLFGRTYSSPFGISAVGQAGNFRRDADLLLAQAARAANIPFMLSGAGSSSIESIARIAPDHVWYQLYGAKDRKLTDHMIARARDAGVSVLVLTVDYPVPPRVEKIARSGVSPPANVQARAIPYVIWELLKHPAWTLAFARQGGPRAPEGWAAYAPAGSGARTIGKVCSAQIPSNQTWNDVESIRAQWPGILVIKGLVRADDAVRAAELGADAVTVSNHGGVKLDCMTAAIDALPPVTNAVAHRVPVLFDSGIRRGANVLSALCLGARFCFVGRATLYGVMADGRAGADRAIQILRDEISHVMAMIGCPTIEDLGTEFLVQGRPSSPIAPAPKDSAGYTAL
jgi:(S)-mandelate dehydrogenase